MLSTLRKYLAGFLTAAFGALVLAQQPVSVTNTVPISNSDLTTLGALSKNEDTAHASGHPGVPVWAVRVDSLASFSGADGDYSPLAVDAQGALYVSPGTTFTVDGTVTGDTELPSASAMADDAANPTLPSIQAFIMCYDGSTWDRCRAPVALSLKHYVTVGVTEDEFAVKASAGTLMGLTATNHNAAVAFLRCADQVAASTTPGTTVVFWGSAVPGNTSGAGIAPSLPIDGIPFGTGLTCWVVAGEAESDVAEVAANDVQINIYYK